MEHKVRVQVLGYVGSGKSTIAAFIARALTDIGCKNVIFTDNGGSHFDETYNTLYRNLKLERIKSIVPQIDVQIETFQERRPLKKK